MEVILDRKLVDKRVFPAIDIQRSGTRKEELLIPKDDLQRVWILRKVLNPLSPVEAMELLSDKLGKTRNNQEFLHNMRSAQNAQKAKRRSAMLRLFAIRRDKSAVSFRRSSSRLPEGRAS